MTPYCKLDKKHWEGGILSLLPDAMDKVMRSRFDDRRV